MDKKPPMAVGDRCRYIGDSKQIRCPYGTIGILVEAGAPRDEKEGGCTFDFQPEGPGPIEILFQNEIEAWS